MAGLEPIISKVYKGSGNNRKKFLNELLETDHRFLHISAHGNGKALSLEDSNETKITDNDIKEYCDERSMSKPLKGNFVTLSACGHVSVEFVRRLHEITGVTAVISALAPIDFSESALFSVMFYFTLLNRLGSRLRTSERLAQYIDCYQRTKIAYVGVGGTGAHRLDYWWEDEHIIVN